MQKPDKSGYTYILEIPDGTDEEIEEFVYDELLGPANSIAERDNVTFSDVLEATRTKTVTRRGLEWSVASCRGSWRLAA